jgi:hypothetical protein
MVKSICMGLVPTSISRRHRCACAPLPTRFEGRHDHFDSVSKSTFNTVLSLWVCEIRLRCLASDHIIYSVGWSLVSNLRTLCRGWCNIKLFEISTWSLEVCIILKLSKWSRCGASSVVNTLIMGRLKTLTNSLRRMNPRFRFQIWIQLISSYWFILKCTSHRSWRFPLLLMIFSSWC